MRGRRILAAVVPLVLLGMALAGPIPAAAAGPGATYYVALGDSLSVGYQPLPTAGPTDRGYVDDLYPVLHAVNPSLQLEKLGCPGETTATMIDGFPAANPYCPGYDSPATAQLATAASFLRGHRGHVSLVTIDIGANDIDGCFSLNPATTASCVEAALPVMAQHLTTILQTLRDAAPGVRIVAMNYYDPFLAVWLLGSAYHPLAQGSVTLANAFNGVLATVYAKFRVPVADVAGAFKTDDFTDTVPFGTTTVPINVALICAWTWMCVDDNIHANDTGYAVIAGTFLVTLGRGGILRR